MLGCISEKKSGCISEKKSECISDLHAFVQRNGELSLKRDHVPRTITKAHSRWWCLLFPLAGETVGQRFIMILEQVANDFARFQGSTLLSTLRLFYMSNLLPEPS